jgi:hypothetical protein
MLFLDPETEKRADIRSIILTMDMGVSLESMNLGKSRMEVCPWVRRTRKVTIRANTRTQRL